MNDASTVAVRRSWATFAPALRSRNFRMFWISQIVSTAGTFLQFVADRWLIYQLTDSKLALGLLGFVSLLPALPVAMIGGLIIDRVPRRKLIVFTQTGLMIQALVFGLLILSRQIQVWHIVVLDSIMSVLGAIDQPARQTFLSEIVAEDDLANAIALNATLFQVARTIGTGAAGVLIAAVGAGHTMLLNAATYLAPIAVLLMMRVGDTARDTVKARFRSALSEGARTLKERPALIGALSLMTLIGGSAVAITILMPAFAEDILGANPVGLGLLLAANAAGSVAGTLLLARFGSNRRGLTLIGASALTSAFMVAIAISPTMLTACLCLFGLGLFVLMVQALANTLVQLNVPDRVRGRVMSLYSLFNAGASSGGGMVFGALAEALSLPIVFGAAGVVLIAYTLGLNVLLPAVRRLD